MTEIRTDPITGRRVIVVPSRAVRPNEHSAAPPAAPAAANCPFCEGHESWTPPEVAAEGKPGRRANEPGWYVRTIPNKFPTVLDPPPDLGPLAPRSGFVQHPSLGYHEVVIESPTHGPLLPFLEHDQVARVLRMCRERVRVLSGRPQIGTVTLFENAGPDSGGSLLHPHSQLVATPGPSPSIWEETEGARRYERESGSECAFEEVALAEARDAARMIFESRQFAAFAPFASRFPYEVRMLPARHTASFADANDAELEELGDRLPSLLRALFAVVPDASYNFVVRSPVGPPSARPGYHWHLDLYPRLIRPDGFDLGSGFHVNPMPPEDAATSLRAALGAKR